MQQAIISLTTIPERLHNISYGNLGVYACIRSLCTQTYKNFEVHFNIPFVYKLHNINYEIPEWLEDLQKEFTVLKVFRVDDEGPPTKLLPTIKRIVDRDTIIIVVDDDKIYRDNMVEEHVKHQQLFVRAAIGYDGLDVLEPPKFSDIRDHFVSLIPEATRVKTLQHYKSVSYKRSYFEDDLFTEFVNKTNSDDILFSAYMGSKDIPKIVVTYGDDPPCTSIEEWHVLVGSSFPLISSIHHDGQQGCTDPLHGERFYRPVEFEQSGFLEK